MSLCFERESEFNRAEFVFGRKRELIGFCFGEKEIKKKKILMIWTIVSVSKNVAKLSQCNKKSNKKANL